MSGRPDLKIDWATHEAAKYSVEHWHYSKCLPASKSQYIGVWENDRFTGVVCFGCGAGNITKGIMYGLPEMNMAELTRVALTKHETPVSRIVAISIKMIKSHNPGLRLIVSLADPIRGHVGAIYQAGNWIYVGETSKSKTYIGKNGREYHERVVSPTGFKKQYGRYVPCMKPQDAKEIRMNPGKYKYLMPLDDEMRKQIEPLRKPYPKRVTKATSGDQSEGGGAIPTHALQDKRDKQAIGDDQSHSGGAAPTVTLQNNNGDLYAKKT